MSTYEITKSREYVGNSREGEPPTTGNFAYKWIVNPAGVIKQLYEKHRSDKNDGLERSIVDIKNYGINPETYLEELRYIQTSNGRLVSNAVVLKRVPSTFRHKRSPKSLRNTKQKSKVRSKVRSKAKGRRSRKM